MKNRSLAALSFLLAPFAAVAEDASLSAAPTTLQLRPKSALYSAPAPQQNAPFVIPPSEPVIDFAIHNTDERLKEIRASCDNGKRSLCYDTDTGKVVYKKTAEYMPQIPGMRAEHISVRRDRITFKYSFR